MDDYYSRLLELLELLPPDLQAEAVKLAEFLAASAEQPLQVPTEEKPSAPVEDAPPRE